MYENWIPIFEQAQQPPSPSMCGGATSGAKRGPCDWFVDLASRCLDAPVAIVSLRGGRPGEDATFVQKSDPLATAEVRHMPRALRFCQKVLAGQDPVVVNGCATRERTASGNLAKIGTSAFLGVPIIDRSGNILGAACVVDAPYRVWEASDVELLTSMAANLAGQLTLRTQILEEQRAQKQMMAAYSRLARYSGLRDDIGAAFLAPDRPIEQRFTDFLRASCRALGFDRAVLARVNCGDAQIVAAHPDISSTPTGPTTLSNKLAGLVAGGGTALKWENLQGSQNVRSLDLLGNQPGAYLGIPLTLSGTLYGILEMTRDTPFDMPFADAEDAIISVIGLYAASNIELLSQAERIRDSEMELMSALRGCRSLTS